MGLHFKNIWRLLAIAALITFMWAGYASLPTHNNSVVNLPEFVVTPKSNVLPVDSPEIELPYPITDGINPFGTNHGRISLTDPNNVNSEIEYDPESGKYYFYQRIGDKIDYRNPTVMTFDEYMNYVSANSVSDYWKEIRSTDQITSDDDDGPDPFRPSLQINNKAFDRIFGGNTVDIRPQGTAELTFGANINKNENPQIPVNQRRITTFNFDQRIQLNVVGQIGDKMKLSTNYNTEATFDFENQTKLEYTGYEDEIIQKIEAGNVSMPLNNSLIQGSQSLFGFKTELKFGRLTATTLFSQERGQKKEINVEGGAQTQDFEITVDNYEANRHYFLSGYFRAAYDNAMKSLPNVSSGVQITRIEVWAVNQTANVQETRNVIGFTDLGEGGPYQNPGYPGDIGDYPLDDYPNNSQNQLYATVAANPQIRGFTQSSEALSTEGFVNGRDFERLSNARQLSPNEYTYNEKLGFISLNQALNSAEVLAVAYQYTLQGRTYQVGDLSNDGFSSPNALYLKLLKSTTVDVKNPMWDLMMKNVYSLGAYQVNPQNFILNVWYSDPKEGVSVPVIPIPEVQDTPLLQILELDKIDQNQNSRPDGRFDFVDGAATVGGTINAQNGRIYFPVVEPFGQHLIDKLTEAGVDENRIKQIAYPQLYDSTKTVAQNNFLYLNRFELRGSYQSASSDEISLNALNIPQGAVQVTAGGVQLIENQDFTVDYNLGRVKILNTGLLESQTPIKISVESNTLFSIQTRRLMGARFDYKFNDKFTVGSTIMNLNEKPLTQKVNIGDEPMNNTLWGFDAHYQDESRFLTDLVDAIPLINTKEKSSVDASFEFAQLLPGHNKAVGKSGTAYVDDFEGTISLIDLRNFASWGIASIPQYQPELFREASLNNDRTLGYNRAKMAWYVIDPLFFRNDNITPGNINPKRHYQREVTENEVFPDKELPAGTPANIATFDLAFYPRERGPYNYDAEGGTYSAGINPATGELEDPEARWGGVMRSINTTDFEQTNVEFIQFWVMDPYNSDNREFLGTEGNNNAKLLVNLGNVSEDVLRDGRMSFENGLPIDPNNPNGLETDTTAWGRVPITQSIVNAFDNTSNSNKAQDVGYDGFNNADERVHFKDFLNRMTSLPGISPSVLSTANADPSNDDYRYYRNNVYDNQGTDIAARYKKFNGFEGNSITTQDSPGYPTQATTLPTSEDINQDLTLAEAESYYQYEIDLPDPQVSPGAWQVGQNYITDMVEGVASDNRKVKWYQFKIPVREGQSINNIQDLRSVRFMRMVTTGFETPVILRFARMELIRGEWRKYGETLREGELIPGSPNVTEFDILAVNIEENSQRSPLNYVTPPGISREIDAGTANLRSLNEQSLVLRVRNLGDGDSRAAFRAMSMDMRMYGNLEMFIHGESLDPDNLLAFGDVTVFVRLGSDFDQNFYEYEVPVKPTPLNASSTPQNIWPEENNMVINFKKLQAAKNSRNQSGFADNEIYVVMDGDRRIRIKGNPVLSNVRTIMIGVRNPNQNGDPIYGNIWSTDMGLQESAEIWVNELRLTDFNNDGGWAAVGRINAKLADFATVSLAGNISTPNFGSLGSRVAERAQETSMGYDASSNVNLDKFLPEESGIKIPMYIGQAEQVVIPRFDPLSPDLELSEIDEGLSSSEQKKLRQRSQSYVRRRSINFTNVRKDRMGGTKKPRVYDVENLNATFSYSDRDAYDFSTAFDNQRQFRVALGYTYNAQPKNYKPFAASKFLRSSDYLALIRDFNFTLAPKNISFRSDIDRMYNEQQFKNVSEGFDFEQPVLYTKTFNWTRTYDVQHDLTSSIRLGYNANNLAYIEETAGKVDKSDRDSYNNYRDTVWNSIWNFGTNVTFNQSVSANYKVPINKIPILDWVTTDVRYTGSYNWQRAPFSQDSLGNTIQNARTLSLNGQLNFLTLYNKVGYFKNVNQKFQRQGRGAGRSTATPQRSPTTSVQQKDKKEDENKITLLDYGAKLLMSLKNISLVYSQNEGTFLPGYNRTSNIVGMDPGFNAPGIDFVLGHQISDFNKQAALKNWLVKNEYINQQYLETYTEDFNLRVNLEPINNLRIEFNAVRSKSIFDGSFYRFNNDLQQYLEESQFQSGSFSISMNSWATLWEKDEDNISTVFTQFLANREDISNRLAIETGLTEPGSSLIDVGYADGFGKSSQQVVIPAFVAAYSGQSTDKVHLRMSDYTLMDAIKNPSWTINYDGLSKIPAINKIFRNVTIGHAYRSTYSINNYTTNLSAGTQVTGDPVRDNSEEQNFIAETQINAITISEQLSPLIRIDMTWQNSLITNFEINKNRTLAFSTTNFQLTENRSNEYVVGLGYRFPDVQIKIGGKSRKSDLNVRADLSFRDTEVIARRMIEETNQITSGQRIISLKTAIDYVISDRLNIRAFYDHQINKPKVSISFPTSNINTGISLRFTLTQ